MIIAAMIMLYYGFAGLSSYVSSLYYYHPVFYAPLLYIGIWNVCAFPFALATGILLLRKRYFRISIFGILVTLLSGFVPQIVFAVIHGYADNGWELGAPLIVLSAVALALATLGHRGKVN